VKADGNVLVLRRRREDYLLRGLEGDAVQVELHDRQICQGDGDRGLRWDDDARCADEPVAVQVKGDVELVPGRGRAWGCGGCGHGENQQAEKQEKAQGKPRMLTPVPAFPRRRIV